MQFPKWLFFRTGLSRLPSAVLPFDGVYLERSRKAQGATSTPPSSDAANENQSHPGRLLPRSINPIL